MGLVCLDTHLLIWGVKEEAEAGQESMIPKTKAFLKHLDRSGDKVAIPSIVLGEFLMRVPADDHAQIINYLTRKFIILPCDLIAASMFARIWRSKQDDNTYDRLREDFSASREELKADCFIVATAVAHNASCIYSYDPKLAKFAEGYIEVKEMPNLPVQLELYPTSTET